MSTVIHTMIDEPASEFRTDLEASLGVARWVDEIAARAPFDSWESLKSAAYAAATPLEALVHHPRIGESAVGTGRAQSFSAREQTAVDSDDEELAKALALGNTVYEQRFGRVFLIRARGRSRREIVDELDRRLKLDDEHELEIVGSELRDIAILRLESRFGA
jgi:2-oxo-4-hydroxy-4-carboxy-5-ureidoimidazoline decarboxylase